MQYATFLTTVEQVGGLSREQAERAIETTLRTLAERITGGEACDIAHFLPREIRHFLEDTPEPAEAFGIDGFYRRVGEREGVAPRTAAAHARAVFVALGVAVAPGELGGMAAQLPADYEPLLQAAGVGRRRALREPYDLVQRVADIGDIDREQAHEATQAMLEALAVRISAGDVEDLMKELPPNLHPALEAGLHESHAARKMTVEEFLDHVAEHEGVGHDEALRHARAVFAALREFITSKEFSDLMAQLPSDYAPLLAHA